MSSAAIIAPKAVTTTDFWKILLKVDKINTHSILTPTQLHSKAA